MRREYFVNRKGRPKKNGQVPISARITTSGFRQKIYTSCDCDPELWNQQEEQAMGKSKQAIQVND